MATLDAAVVDAPPETSLSFRLHGSLELAHDGDRRPSVLLDGRVVCREFFSELRGSRLEGPCALEHGTDRARVSIATPMGESVADDFEYDTDRYCGRAYPARQRVVYLTGFQTRVVRAESASTGLWMGAPEDVAGVATRSSAMTRDGRLIESDFTGRDVTIASVGHGDGAARTLSNPQIPAFNPEDVAMLGRARHRIVPVGDRGIVAALFQAPPLSPRGDGSVDVADYRKQAVPSGFLMRQARTESAQWSEPKWFPIEYAPDEEDAGLLLRGRADGSWVAAVGTTERVVVIALTAEGEIHYQRSVEGQLMGLTVGPAGRALVSTTTARQTSTDQRVFALSETGELSKTRSFGTSWVVGLLHAGPAVHAVLSDYRDGRTWIRRLVLDPASLETTHERPLEGEGLQFGRSERLVAAADDGGFYSVLEDADRGFCGTWPMGATVMRFDVDARLLWAERVGVRPAGDDPRLPAFNVTAATPTDDGVRIGGTYVGYPVVPGALKEGLPSTSKPRSFVIDLSDDVGTEQ